MKALLTLVALTLASAAQAGTHLEKVYTCEPVQSASGAVLMDFPALQLEVLENAGKIFGVTVVSMDFAWTQRTERFATEATGKIGKKQEFVSLNKMFSVVIDKKSAQINLIGSNNVGAKCKPDASMTHALVSSVLYPTDPAGSEFKEIQVTLHKNKISARMVPNTIYCKKAPCLQRETEEIELPITNVVHAVCGDVYTAEKDQRPADGSLKRFELVDHRNMRCRMYISPMEMTELTFTVIPSGFSPDHDTTPRVLEFKGTRLE